MHKKGKRDGAIVLCQRLFDALKYCTETETNTVALDVSYATILDARNTRKKKFDTESFMLRPRLPFDFESSNLGIDKCVNYGQK